MIKLQVTVTVDADVDGWAHAGGASAGTALLEILAYLRSLDIVQGQTYLHQVGQADAHMDLQL